MKAMFLFVSILCGIAWSTLGVIVATGRIPFAAEEPEKVEVAAAPAAAETLTVFPAEANVIDELREALNREREAFEKKNADLMAREAALRDREGIVATLKSELMDLQQKIDEQVVEIEAAEATNFRRLAAVYAKMEAESSAKILAQMELERAAKILSLLGEREAGAIMDATVSQGDNGIETADRWTDAIRRLKKSKT